jgi:hypothetical protein
MGGSWIQHKFNNHDWRSGVRDLQRKADEYYGHREGYSGAINSCTHISLHVPKAVFKTEKQLWEYIESRTERISTRDAEVIDLGISGYSIAKPVIQEYHGRPILGPHDLRGLKEPAVLVTQHGSIKGKGTVAHLKERAKRLVMQELFENDYYIVGKNVSKVYVVTGEGMVVKKTTKKSDSNQLVLPLHDWVVYGWAAN